MANSFENIIDIIIACLILFLFPLFLFDNYKERIIYTVVEEKTAALIHTVTTKGYLTKSMYETFNIELNQLLEQVEITIEHKKRVYLPEYSIEEGVYVFTDNTQEIPVTVYKDDIIKGLYSSLEIYNFSQGDYITIKLDKKDSNMEKNYGRRFFNKKFTPHKAGGVIRGEKEK